jgi:hypothetical protein
MSTGSCSPETKGSTDRRGGLSPLGPPVAGALGATIDGAALDGGGETSALDDAVVVGDAVGGGDGVGLLQPASETTSRTAGRRRRPTRGC